MAKKMFGQEEIRGLQANPYVEKVGEKSITYTVASHFNRDCNPLSVKLKWTKNKLLLVI